MQCLQLQKLINMNLGLFSLLILWVSIAECSVITGPKETLKGGEFVYYNMTAIDSYVYLQLISLSGDCDLYVSQNVEFPTYKDYTFHSATCGIDSIVIPKRAKAPIHIGMYGHPAFDTSDCLLNVCLLDHPETHDEFMDEMTELSGLTDAIIEESCKREATQGVSYARRSLDILARIASTIEFDGILFEIMSAFAQAII